MLENLPTIVLLNIFKNLGKLEVVTLGQTCLRLFEIAQTDSLWVDNVLDCPPQSPREILRILEFRPRGFHVFIDPSDVRHSDWHYVDRIFEEFSDLNNVHFL